jgi:hypothetical protein
MIELISATVALSERALRQPAISVVMTIEDLRRATVRTLMLAEPFFEAGDPSVQKSDLLRQFHVPLSHR